MPAVTDCINEALHAVNGKALSQDISGDGRLAPGVWFDADPNATKNEGSINTNGDGLLKLDFTGDAAGLWCSLNFDLGSRPFTDFSLIGVACRVQASRTTTARLVVRTFLSEGGHVDTPFPDVLVAFSDESTHTNVLWTAQQPSLIVPAKWRILILMLDPAGFDLEIRDLRFFVT